MSTNLEVLNLKRWQSPNDRIPAIIQQLNVISSWSIQYPISIIIGYREQNHDINASSRAHYIRRKDMNMIYEYEAREN